MTRSESCALLNQNLTFRGLFELSCRINSSGRAGIWLEEDTVTSYTYRELEERSYAAAERVASLEVGAPGEFVGIAVDTCKDWPILFWGLLAAGRQPVLIDPSLADAPVLHLLTQAGAKALICRRQRDIPPEIMQLQPEALLPHSRPSEAFVPAWADRIALCTSGTTKTSRVYVFTGRSVCMQTLGIIEVQKEHYISRESRGPLVTLCFLPLNHVFGLMTHAIWLFFLGYPQVYLKDRSAEVILATCRKTGVQCILAVPLLVNNISVTLGKRLAKEPRVKRAAVKAMTTLSLGIQWVSPNHGLSLARKLCHSINENLFGDTLELIVLGGSHAPKEHLRMINALGYSAILGFGMTEVGVTSVEVKSSLKNKLTGSVGWPLPISEYTVRPDGTDRRRGELLIRTEAMHIGRMENGVMVPADTNGDGWYETGDVVRLGRKGRMYVEGRTKDMILGESGENVYPDELEDAFADIEGVEQFCVLGMTHEGSPYDYATLVFSVGERFRDEQYLAELAKTAHRRNDRMTQIRRVSRMLVTSEPLPTVNSIKVKRIALREMIEKGEIPLRELSARGASETRVSTEESRKAAAMARIRNQIRKFYADVLEISPAQISDDAHFIDDLGGDSLQVLSIALAVETEYKLSIEPDEYMHFATVAELAALVSDKLAGTARRAENEGPRANVTPITRFEDTPECIAFGQRLESLKGQRNPYFVPHDSPLTDTSLMEGRRVLNFGSYNYVGMSGRKETMDAAKQAIDTYGTSASGSRLLAGEKSLYTELEREIADWKHAEAALVLVGGHSTNVTFVGHFCGKDDLILYDALAHNSVQEGTALSEAAAKPFPHNDVKALETMLKAQRDQYAKVLIVIEGVYSMDGDIAPVREFVALKKKYGCFLLVDEAHSACVLGKTGGGVDEHFGLAPGDIDIKMGTLSKGLGTCGGYLAGARVLIDYLRYNLPGFVFSVGISPPLAAATLAAIRTLKTNPEIMERLHSNIRVFLREAHARGLHTCLAQETAIIPILVGRDEDAFLLSTALGDRDVFVPPAVYPAVPKNKARLRFCVISEHSEEQIIKALDTLVETAASLGIALPQFQEKEEVAYVV